MINEETQSPFRQSHSTLNSTKFQGKGVMETFWLMGRANELTVMLNPPAIPPPTELVPAPAVTASVRLDTVNDSGDVGLYTEYLRA